MDWNLFFPFEKGTILSIDGPLWYNGSGSVVRNEGTVLEVSLAMPAVHLFGYSIPELKATFAIDAKKDGPGNYGRAVMNDVVVEDTDIDVVSIERNNERRIDFSKKVKGQHLALTLKRVNDHKATLRLQDHDFTITRTVD